MALIRSANRSRWRSLAMIGGAFAANLLVIIPALAQLEIPASTAYLEPDMEGARVTRRGITPWPASKQSVLWFGQFNQTGALEVAVSLRAPAGETMRLKLSVGNQSRETEISGTITNLLASFGTFQISSTGYQRLKLECVDNAKHSGGQVDSLELSGSATTQAHFNLESRRNAASVHLMYPTPVDSKIEAFYCEVKAMEDPVGTFYMACGFHRGYFGMQVNSSTERRIIFSVWDSGKEPVDRKNVEKENRVQLVAKGQDVIADGFGNEGTGGHSHTVYPWKTGEVQRFAITARPSNSNHTVYAGYYFRPDKKVWALISAWNAPKDGGWLRQLHSFSEDFRGENGQLRRKAFYGNQWIRTTDGQWHELTTASFSHDGTGRTARLDRFMGVEDGQFFLSQGGFVDGFTRFGEKFTRPPMGIAPRLPLPELPKVAATSSTP